MNALPRLVVAALASFLIDSGVDAIEAVNTAGLVYTPITPCRIVDTRVTGGPFAAKETRTFQTNGAATQGGGACTVYSGAIPAALSLNVTVDATTLGSPSQYGFLSLTPSPGPGSSWLNFFGGETVANAGVATINPVDGSFAIKTQNPANVVVDVFGYFSQAPITSAYKATTFALVPIPIPEAIVNVTSITFTPPASGAVIAHVGGYCNMPLEANVPAAIALGLTDVSLQDPSSGLLIPLGNTANMATISPTALFYQTSYSVDRVFTVDASPKTIYLTGILAFGSSSGATCSGTLTATYTPNDL